MRGLHVVGVSDDGDELLLASSPDATRASHSVALDGRLRSAVRGDLKPGSKAQITLAPKEIQARLRSGETVEDVARAAGVPPARILPYAGPVLSERDRVVDEARVTAPKRDRGGPTLPLGEAVDLHLASVNGLRPGSVTWSARRRDDGVWIVELAYIARATARHAEWLWRPATKELRASSLTASRLAASQPVPASSGRSAAGTSAVGKPTARRRAKKPARRGRPMTAATSKAAASKKAPARERSAGPATPVSAVQPAAQAAAIKAAAAKVASAKAAKLATAKAAKATKAAPRRRQPVLAPPAAVPPAGGRVRVVVPSWSDVLFGASDQPEDSPVDNLPPAPRRTTKKQAPGPKRA